MIPYPLPYDILDTGGRSIVWGCDTTRVWRARRVVGSPPRWWYDDDDNCCDYYYYYYHPRYTSNDHDHRRQPDLHRNHHPGGADGHSSRNIGRNKRNNTFDDDFDSWDTTPVPTWSVVLVDTMDMSSCCRSVVAVVRKCPFVDSWFFRSMLLLMMMNVGPLPRPYLVPTSENDVTLVVCVILAHVVMIPCSLWYLVRVRRRWFPIYDVWTIVDGPDPDWKTRRLVILLAPISWQSVLCWCMSNPRVSLVGLLWKSPTNIAIRLRIVQ